MDNSSYNRLMVLKRKINSSGATLEERREYMHLLFINGHISKKQYDNFMSNQNADEVINAGLTIGGIIIATWLLSKLFENR